MIKVVRISDNKILSTYDAWVLTSYSDALKDIEGNGYKYIREEITFMGDMIIWVKAAA